MYGYNDAHPVSFVYLSHNQLFAILNKMVFWHTLYIYILSAQVQGEVERKSIRCSHVAWDVALYVCCAQRTQSWALNGVVLCGVLCLNGLKSLECLNWQGLKRSVKYKRPWGRSSDKSINCPESLSRWLRAIGQYLLLGPAVYSFFGSAEQLTWPFILK